MLEQHRQMALAAQLHQAAAQQHMQQHREQFTRQQEARDQVMRSQQALRQELRQHVSSCESALPSWQPAPAHGPQPPVPDRTPTPQPQSAVPQPVASQPHPGAHTAPPLPETPVPPSPAAPPLQQSAAPHSDDVSTTLLQPAAPHPGAPKPASAASQVPPQWELLTEASDAEDADGSQPEALQSPPPQQPSRYQPPHLRRQHPETAAAHPAADVSSEAVPFTALISPPPAAAAAAGSGSRPAADRDGGAAPKPAGGVKDDFICPITHCVFRHPVICADGFTYEGTAIAAWLQRSSLSPMTNQPLEHRGLVPNRALKNLIAANEMLKHQRG